MIRILVLDDEIDVEFIFKVMFEDEIQDKKIEIDFFSNPQDCLNHFINHPELKYDHIFSDINMPQISGIKFVTELRNMNYSGPISFISAYMQEDFKSDIDRLHISHYLSKPLDFSEIRKLLEL